MADGAGKKNTGKRRSCTTSSHMMTSPTHVIMPNGKRLVMICSSPPKIHSRGSVARSLRFTKQPYLPFPRDCYTHLDNYFTIWYDSQITAQGKGSICDLAHGYSWCMAFGYFKWALWYTRSRVRPALQSFLLVSVQVHEKVKNDVKIFI
jgi:hypothetical protein